MTRSEENDKHTLFAYVLFDDKGVMPPPPSKQLVVERFCQYEICRDTIDDKVRAAGSRFWKLCVTAHPNEKYDLEVAILRWDEVELEDIDIKAITAEA